jgi:pimeloyl-ACP methyl ester carboxylesterase
MKTKNLILFTLLSIFFIQPMAAKSTIKVSVTGNGTPMIFIPALGCSAEMWSGTIAHFSKYYTCHAVSIKGFGGLKPIKSKNMTDVKKDICSYLKKKKINNAVLIGHSFGATMCIDVASSFPEFFSKLILVDAYSFPLDVFVPGISTELAEEEADKLINSFMKMSETDFQNKQTEQLKNAVTNQDRFAQILDWQLKSDRALFAEAMGSMISTDYRPSLKNIKIPTLIIGTWVAYAKFGFTLESTKKTFENQYKNLANHKIVMAEKGKHFIMFDEAEWFRQQLELFLNLDDQI